MRGVYCSQPLAQRSALSLSGGAGSFVVGCFFMSFLMEVPDGFSTMVGRCWGGDLEEVPHGL